MDSQRITGTGHVLL